MAQLASASDCYSKDIRRLIVRAYLAEMFLASVSFLPSSLPSILYIVNNDTHTHTHTQFITPGG